MAIVISVSGGDAQAGGPSRRLISLATHLGFTVEVVEGQEQISEVADVVIADHIQLPDGVARRLKANDLVTVADLQALTFRQFWDITLLLHSTSNYNAAHRIIGLMRDNTVSFADADTRRLLVEDIDDMGFTIRVYNVLAREGIRSMYFLSFWTERELLDLRSLGKRGIDAIRAKLAMLGLKLASD